MSKIVKRGYAQNDQKEFKEDIDTLLNAGRDLQYLLNRNYHMKGASTFIGNHYLLSERQRMALARGVSSEESIQFRKEKEVKSLQSESVVNIDGFNTIIALEVALSDSTLLKCMDGTIRDLAGLRGSYKLIDKTEPAILLIGKMLEKYKIKKAVFYLDAPVSNSGRLGTKIMELLSQFSFETEIETINNVDSVLEKLDNVITGDAIILDKCISWFNLVEKIIKEFDAEYPYVDFSVLSEK